uniref:B box-type domain-containing protein n=1 Tax=Neogobius melanostomus TaxID=47308 RepID=A0A8C6SPS5_9GOBI
MSPVVRGGLCSKSHKEWRPPVSSCLMPSSGASSVGAYSRSPCPFRADTASASPASRRTGTGGCLSPAPHAGLHSKHGPSCARTSLPRRCLRRSEARLTPAGRACVLRCVCGSTDAGGEVLPGVPGLVLRAPPGASQPSVHTAHPPAGAPVAALERRVCKRHHRTLELFCRSEGQCVCVLCTETGHSGHNVVPVEREGQRVKAEMERSGAELQEMIQERLQRVEDITHSIALSKEWTRQDLQQSQQIFSALVAQMEKVHKELVERIQETQAQAECRAHRLVSELQQEVRKLRRSRQELERLRQSEDHLHLVQLFPTLSPPPPTLVHSMPIHADPCLGAVRRAVASVEQELQKALRLLCEQELERMQKYAVEVCLDADTANPGWCSRRTGDACGTETESRGWRSGPSASTLPPVCWGTRASPAGGSTGRWRWGTRRRGTWVWPMGQRAGGAWSH